MTIPNFPLPDTRPGYAFQSPGFGGVAADVISQIVQTLIQRQKLEQDQQQLAISAANQKAQEQYYQDQATRWQEQQRAISAEAAEKARQAQAVGGAIQQIQPPGPVQVPMGGLGNMVTIQGPGYSPEQASAGLAPGDVPAFEEAGKERIGRYQAAATAAQKTAQDELARQRMMAALPENLRPVIGPLLVAGGDDATVRTLVGEVLAQNIKPDDLTRMQRARPDLKGLPIPRFIDAYIQGQQAWQQSAASAANRQEPKPLKVNPTVKAAYNANSARARTLMDILEYYGMDPNDPGQDAARLATAKSKYLLTDSGLLGSTKRVLNWASGGGYQAARRAESNDPEFQFEVALFTQARSGELFGEGGKQLTPMEAKEVAGLAVDPGLSLAANIARARAQLAWIQRRQLGTQELYSPAQGYESLPDWIGVRTNPLPPQRNPYTRVPGYRPIPPGVRR